MRSSSTTSKPCRTRSERHDRASQLAIVAPPDMENPQKGSLRNPGAAVKSSTSHKKLQPLPQNAKVSKRQLLRPAIPSPYTGSQTPKCVYISSHTPFMGAVKRVEKLLRLADKRAIQSATTKAKRNGRNQVRLSKRGAMGENDEIVEAATIVEEHRAKRRRMGSCDQNGDLVAVKGTGRAVQKVMQLGLWFQQREEYTVTLRTATVGAIDDISFDQKDARLSVQDEETVNEPIQEAITDEEEQLMDITADAAQGDVDASEAGQEVQRNRTMQKYQHDGKQKAAIPSTRIRYTSVLEVIVGLR